MRQGETHTIPVHTAQMARRAASKEIKPDVARRLVEARIARGFDDAKKAAAFFGWKYDTYIQHERGANGLRPAVAKIYANAFRVRPSWLVLGEGPMRQSSGVRVMGRIGAGAEISVDDEQIDPDGLYEIESDIPLPDGMIGFEVVGDSMWPRYDAGDVVIVSESGTSPDAIADGDEAAVKTSDGRRFVKRLRRENGRWTLESHNAAPIHGVTLEWISEVVTVARRRQWRRLNGSIKRKKS